MRQENGLSPTATGVVIGGIADDSPAAAVGLAPGDVVLSIDRLAVAGPEDAADKLRLASATGDVLLLINRHGNPTFTALPAETDTPKK